MIIQPKFKTNLILNNGKVFKLSNTEENLERQCSQSVITVEWIEVSCTNNHDSQGLCSDCIQHPRRINIITSSIESFFSINFDKKFTE